MIASKQKTMVLFKEIDGVFISQTNANQIESSSILRDNGLRLLTYSEALVLITKSLLLKEELKGNWFFLIGRGLNENGYHTFNNKGELSEGKGDREKTIYVHPGENPLSLDVRLCNNAFNDECRFDLGADDFPQDAAPVIVGVKASHLPITLKSEHFEESRNSLAVHNLWNFLLRKR